MWQQQPSELLASEAGSWQQQTPPCITSHTRAQTLSGAKQLNPPDAVHADCSALLRVEMQRAGFPLDIGFG